MTTPNKLNETPLYLICQHGTPAMLKMYLEALTDPHQLSLQLNDSRLNECLKSAKDKHKSHPLTAGTFTDQVRDHLSSHPEIRLYECYNYLCSEYKHTEVFTNNFGRHTKDFAKCLTQLSAGHAIAEDKEVAYTLGFWGNYYKDQTYAVLRNKLSEYPISQTQTEKFITFLESQREHFKSPAAVALLKKLPPTKKSSSIVSGEPSMPLPSAPLYGERESDETLAEEDTEQPGLKL